MVGPSVGSVGDSYDNALAETIIGLYKTKVIHHLGPLRGASRSIWRRVCASLAHSPIFWIVACRLSPGAPAIKAISTCPRVNGPLSCSERTFVKAARAPGRNTGFHQEVSFISVSQAPPGSLRTIFMTAIPTVLLVAYRPFGVVKVNSIRTHRLGIKSTE